MRVAVPFMPWLLAISSCGSPPQPPQVDESLKRPANAAGAVELQVCKTDLHNTRIVAAEDKHLASANAAALASMAARQQLLATMQATVQAAVQAAAPAAGPALAAPLAAAPVNLPNQVRTVHFGYGSAQLPAATAISPAVSPVFSPDFISAAKSAPLVVVRGRTDGATDTPAASRMAMARAAAVRAHLVAAGIDAARIRTTHQPTGDHLADNTSAAGRALNRRVEVELYRTSPVAVDSRPVGATGSTNPP
jgi:outer membrane protein OmpA-like peptidoglycan-associated protein